jgi:hypothetical protein
MVTIERAWSAFNLAIEEVRALHARGGPNLEIADLLQHAGELLDIIDEEAQLQAIETPAEAKNALLQMRERIQDARRKLTIVH